ncbi:MAG: histidine phosphatase family protein [Sandaracinaceae bacterium]
MRLTLIRHGESTWNASGRWQGHADVPLSPRGQLQARALAGRLFGVPFDRRLTSDLPRAAATAAALGEACAIEPRFRELDLGGWSGLTHAEVAARFPDELRSLQRGLPVRIGGGESIEEFESRIDAVLDELAAAEAGREVLAVTHGGVVRSVIGRALDARGRTSPVVGAANTSITIVRCEGGRVAIEVFNDDQHLDPTERQRGTMRPTDPSRVRVALVAVDPDAPRSRAEVDGILTSLRLATYYATREVESGADARAFGAVPSEPGELRAKLAGQEGSGVAVLVPHARLREELGQLIGIDATVGFLPAAPGTWTEVHVGKRAELVSYGTKPIA